MKYPIKILCFMLVFVSQSVFAVRYDVYEISSTDPAVDVYLEELSGNGSVAGEIYNNDTGEEEYFYWNKSTGMITIPDTDTCWAWGISDQDQVLMSDPNAGIAYVWELTGGLQYIDLLSGTDKNQAMGITSSGVVYGNATLTNPSTIVDSIPVVWDRINGIREINTGLDFADYESVELIGANDNGQYLITASSYDYTVGEGTTEYYIVDEQGGVTKCGEITDYSRITYSGNPLNNEGYFHLTYNPKTSTSPDGTGDSILVGSINGLEEIPLDGFQPYSNLMSVHINDNGTVLVNNDEMELDFSQFPPTIISENHEGYYWTDTSGLQRIVDPEGRALSVNSITNTGYIMGDYVYSYSSRESFLYDTATNTFKYVNELIPSIAGLDVIAYYINDNMQIVATSYTEANREFGVYMEPSLDWDWINKSGFGLDEDESDALFDITTSGYGTSIEVRSTLWVYLADTATTSAMAAGTTWEDSGVQFINLSDGFLQGSPVSLAIPEPMTVALFALSLVGLCRRLCK